MAQVTPGAQVGDRLWRAGEVAEEIGDAPAQLAVSQQMADRLRVVPGGAALAQDPVVEAEKKQGLLVALAAFADEQPQLLEHLDDHRGPGAVHADDDDGGLWRGFHWSPLFPVRAVHSKWNSAVSSRRSSRIRTEA